VSIESPKIMNGTAENCVIPPATKYEIRSTRRRGDGQAVAVEEVAARVAARIEAMT